MPQNSRSRTTVLAKTQRTRTDDIDWLHTIADYDLELRVAVRPVWGLPRHVSIIQFWHLDCQQYLCAHQCDLSVTRGVTGIGFELEQKITIIYVLLLLTGSAMVLTSSRRLSILTCGGRHLALGLNMAAKSCTIENNTIWQPPQPWNSTDKKKKKSGQ